MFLQFLAAGALHRGVTFFDTPVAGKRQFPDVSFRAHHTSRKQFCTAATRWLIAAGSLQFARLWR